MGRASPRVPVSLLPGNGHRGFVPIHPAHPRNEACDNLTWAVKKRSLSQGLHRRARRARETPHNMSIFRGCQPRIEVRQGELNDAIFAADVYADAEKFFANTHPVQSHRDVVKAVFSKLSNPEESGLTLRLRTGFGGGKTHALMTLWHLGKSAGSSLGTELLPSEGRPSAVTTIAVDEWHVSPCGQ